jgi:hypothetical protein
MYVLISHSFPLPNPTGLEGDVLKWKDLVGGSNVDEAAHEKNAQGT